VFSGLHILLIPIRLDAPENKVRPVVLMLAMPFTGLEQLAPPDAGTATITLRDVPPGVLAVTFRVGLPDVAFVTMLILVKYRTFVRFRVQLPLTVMKMSASLRTSSD
jgi:hypothetical protein